MTRVILVHVNGCRRQTCYVNCIYRGEEFYSAIDFVREYKLMRLPAHPRFAHQGRQPYRQMISCAAIQLPIARTQSAE